MKSFHSFSTVIVKLLLSKKERKKNFIATWKIKDCRLSLITSIAVFITNCVCVWVRNFETKKNDLRNELEDVEKLFMLVVREYQVEMTGNIQERGRRRMVEEYKINYKRKDLKTSFFFCCCCRGFCCKGV